LPGRIAFQFHFYGVALAVQQITTGAEKQEQEKIFFMAHAVVCLVKFVSGMKIEYKPKTTFSKKEI
jgi:hypothetical protein